MYITVDLLRKCRAENVKLLADRLGVEWKHGMTPAQWLARIAVACNQPTKTADNQRTKAA